MRKNPRRILSPQRLPFRHSGIGSTNLAKRRRSRNTHAIQPACLKTGRNKLGFGP